MSTKMSVLVAILFMMAFTVGIVVTYATGLPGVPLISLASAVWAYGDAGRIGLERYRTALRSPGAVAAGCVFLWMIAFPWYLHVRHGTFAASFESL
jgi:hypothetical protein